MVEVRMGRRTRISAKIPTGTRWLMAMNTPPRPRQCTNEPATRLWLTSPASCRRAFPMITMAAMISTTKAIRTARKVKGSIYGRPKRAPMNPVLHKSTNRAGAVAIASRVRRMRSRQGWAWINRAARAFIPAGTTPYAWVISGHFAMRGRCPLYPQKRTCAVHWLMSAKGQKRTSRHSLDHLVRRQKNPIRYSHAKCFGGFEIDYKLKFGGQLDWQFGWLRAFQNSRHVIRGSTP